MSINSPFCSFASNDNWERVPGMVYKNKALAAPSYNSTYYQTKCKRKQPIERRALCGIRWQDQGSVRWYSLQLLSGQWYLMKLHDPRRTREWARIGQWRCRRTILKQNICFIQRSVIWQHMRSEKQRRTSYLVIQKGGRSIGLLRWERDIQRVKSNRRNLNMFTLWWFIHEIFFDKPKIS